MLKCTCGAEIKDSEWGWHRINCNGFINNEQKMTREEAITKMNKLQFNRLTADQFIGCLEALGLLKFEEEKEVEFIFQLDNKNGECAWNKQYSGNPKPIFDKYGVIRLEEWTEGLVLWVGGEIVYKSWEKVYRKGDAVTVECDDCAAFGVIRNGTIK